MRRPRPYILGALLAAGLALPVPLAGQQAEEQPVATAVVPVIGRVVGVGGVEWRADVGLSNPGAQPLDVILTVPAISGDPFLFLTLGPGESVALPDLAHEAFGVANGLTPLLIQTLGTRSVSVQCVIHGTGPDGGVEPQIPRILYARPSSAMTALSGLRISDDYRTNIGLVNLGLQRTSVTLTLQRLTGRPIGTTEVDLPPSSIRQRSLAELFPVVSEASDLTLLIDFAGPDAYAYASVLRNETNAGRFVGP